MRNKQYVLATEQYIEDIYSIEESVFDKERYTLDMVESNVSNPAYINIICIIDDNVVGYITVSTVLDEGELLKIAVLDSYRRQNIGYELLDTMEKYLINKGITKVFLEVRDDNIAAINFYEKNGFDKISIREKYYDGVDAIIYAKGLE